MGWTAAGHWEETALNKKTSGWHLNIRHAVAIGIVLLLAATAIAGHFETASLTRTAQATMQALKQQCISFDKLVNQDKVNSLFRLSDLLQNLCRDLADGKETADDASLQQYVDLLRITGVALLNGNLRQEASGYTRQYNNADWAAESGTADFLDILTYPNKIFLERVALNGEYYDVCAMARLDAPGILVGYYRQPTGLISDTQSDLESLVSGLHLDQGGHYVITENGQVRATSDDSLRNAAIGQDSLLESLNTLPKDDRLHYTAANGKHYWGYRAGYEGYTLCIYYPVVTMLSTWFLTFAVTAAAYSVLCLLYYGTRNRALLENQQRLQESNRHLSETVQMLRSLETIYFTLFYVDLLKNEYQSIYLAPWLQKAVPANGRYTDLKRSFIENLAVEEFQEELYTRLDTSFTRENLSRKNISEVRKSYYTDYQSHRGSELRWCRVTVTVVDFDEDGKPLHALVMLQDITQEKAKEEAYQAQILQEAEEARIANNAKSDFLRRISHDIRTPINGIQGYLTMSAQRPEDMAFQAQCREKVSAALSSLLDLVNSVLDMSKLESNQVQLECKSFHLETVLNEINVTLEPQAAARGIRYDVLRKGNLPIPNLIGSPRHLRQILINLASNAIKYGKSGGYVQLLTHLESSTADTATYSFTCTDNGIGMSEEFQQHLFEPFTQEADDARTIYQGTGLGMSIVKRLVDTLGGTITFQSKKGEGTSFRVTLTFQIDHHAPADKPEHSNDCALTGAHVLLVEDNQLNMEIAEFLLTAHGAKVTKAWNGKEAVDTFAAARPGSFDLILMDIMMPVMSGLEAAQAIRAMARPDAQTVPISAMSANAFADDIQCSLDVGMNAHIPKPVDEKTLLAVVEELLAKGKKS